MSIEMLHLNSLVDAVSESCEYYWKSRLQEWKSNNRSAARLHLAVLVEPYLSLILGGQKTIESRFSVHRIAPFERVDSGDAILLKQSGGPVVGLCEVQSAWFYSIEPESWHHIRKFTAELCAQEPSFWDSRAKAAYATLMRIDRVITIDPVNLVKRDRRAWVVLKDNDMPLKGSKEPIMVAFSGSIGAGKSTVARELARSLGWPRAGFGQFVRSQLSDGGEEDRRTLQDAGQKMVEQYPATFCRLFLRNVDWSPGKPLILDGLRHLTVLEELKRIIAPQQLMHVHGVTEATVRYQRLQSVLSLEEFKEFDAHPVEAASAMELHALADLILDGTKPADQLVSTIIESLSRGMRPLL